MERSYSLHFHFGNDNAVSFSEIPQETVDNITAMLTDKVPPKFIAFKNPRTNQQNFVGIERLLVLDVTVNSQPAETQLK